MEGLETMGGSSSWLLWRGSTGGPVVLSGPGGSISLPAEASARVALANMLLREAQRPAVHVHWEPGRAARRDPRRPWRKIPAKAGRWAMTYPGS